MASKTKAAQADPGLRRPEDERLKPGPTIGYGLQHIMSMFGGVIAVPIILGGAAGFPAGSPEVGLLISCALFVSGLATMLQTAGVPFLGAQLPLVQGISFASVATLTAVIKTSGGGAEGLRTAFGATIVAGVVAFLIVPFFAQVVRFFPPVVTGSIITVIGLSLMPVAGRWITGNPQIVVKGVTQPNPQFGALPSLMMAFLTLLIILVLSKIKKVARMAILLGLLFGTIISRFLDTAWAGAAKAKWQTAPAFRFPDPLHWGSPLFKVSAIVSVFIVMLVIMVETTADIIAVGEVIGTDTPPKRVADGLRADMLSSAVAPVFNTFPATAFAQNVGLVALSGIKSRWVVTAGGGMLAVFGLSPWLAAVIGLIPLPVLGGAGLALFGTVAASGIRTLSKVNYDGNNNLIVVAASLAMGVLPIVTPLVLLPADGKPGLLPPGVFNGVWHNLPRDLATILESGISCCAITAILLNVFFNMLGSKTAALQAHAPARAVEHADLVAASEQADATTSQEAQAQAAPTQAAGQEDTPKSR